MAMEDEYDPFEGTGQTAMDQAQARGDKSYSSIGSAVNVSSDDGSDPGPSSRANSLAQQQERPSFLERVSGKLSNVFGGRQVDPTGFYRSIPSKVEKASEKLMNKAIPGRDSQFGFVPSLIGGKVGAALSLLDYVTNQDKPFENFLDKFGVDKKEQLQLVPTPTVAQLDPREMNALDPRSLSFERPSARVTIDSRGDPLDIPVEEANPVGLSQLQRSLDGLPVEGRGGGLGDFVAVASPTSRPEFLVGTRAPNYGFERTAEMRNAPNFGQMLYEDRPKNAPNFGQMLYEDRPKNAPNIGLRAEDFPLEDFAPEPELGPYEQEVVSQNLADIIMQGMQNSTPSGGIGDLRGGNNLAFFDTNRGVFGSIPNPINVLTNKNLARQGNIYTSASTGGRGSKRSKGDLLNELSRSIGSAINFSGSNR